MAVRVAPRRLDWGGERGAVRVGVVWCGVCGGRGWETKAESGAQGGATLRGMAVCSSRWLRALGSTGHWPRVGAQPGQSSWEKGGGKRKEPPRAGGVSSSIVSVFTASASAYLLT